MEVYRVYQLIGWTGKHATLNFMLDRERAFSSGQWHNGREKVQCIVIKEEGRTYASFENRQLCDIGMYIFLPQTFGPNRVSVAPPTLPPPRIIYLTSGKRTLSAALQWIQRWDRNAFEILSTFSFDHFSLDKFATKKFLIIRNIFNVFIYSSHRLYSVFLWNH